ncbi:Sir2 family NAD-dependent protein deacetylase, partial [Escherichia coli]|uniref:Sir2 family NAD-dependent protein deacetylase n=1 Tax=Escherichia coli TaxID=562 RepID=UPI0024C483FB
YGVYDPIHDANNGVINLTQNVDNLFERAGCTNTVHLHGFITQMRCIACGHIWDIGMTSWNPEEQTCPNPAKNCQSRKGVKPNVVCFHEDAPLYAIRNKVFKELTEDDVLVVIGTSGN